MHVSSIPYALCDEEMVHIPDVRKGDRRLFSCPECGEGLFFKAGEIRIPHFSHYPESMCSMSLESALHYYAKHYIASAIKKRDENVQFKFQVDTLPDLFRRSLLLFDTNRSEYAVSIMDLVRYFEVYNVNVEKMFDIYKPDVLCNDYDLNRFLAFEVAVTHYSTEEKIAFYLENDIAYIEFVPVVHEDGKTLSFTVEAHNLDEFLKTRFDILIKSFVH
ncbi:competence protein CoiA family protein [Paenibacillus aurantiacus]|uniref:Competence protein CoiA family protein n=1 Tax=Paenibacillus aurantiacus TaxID=1936118 RepID=A0ABV5KZJ5_9BACL